MTSTPPGSRRSLTDDEAAARLVAIERTAELAGHAHSAAAMERARRVLVGEITGDEARAEIIAEYDQAGSGTYSTIDEVARDRAAGRIDDAAFVAAAVALPVVAQIPHPDHAWWDDLARVHGPMADLVTAFTAGLISAELYDAAVEAMARAGHEA